MTQSKTCILLFARTPESEIQHKLLSQKTSINKRISQLLYNRTKQVLRSLDVAHYHISESQQVGGSFGERFSNAVAKVFSEGFDHVIAIGADCPNINKRLLDQAIQNAQKGQCTLGPAKDGGAYLLSISKDHFDASTFESLPWESSELAKAYTQYLDRVDIHLNLLETLADLDDIHGFIHFNFKYSFWSVKQLKSYITQAFNQTSQVVHYIIFHYTIQSLRGPPSTSSID